MQLGLLAAFLPQQLRNRRLEMQKLRREPRKAGQGEHTGSPADGWMDPESSQEDAGRQSKPLLLFSC